MSHTVKCKICQESFKEKVSLKNHIASVHEGKDPCLCQFCDYYDIDKKKMANHHKIFHRINPKDFHKDSVHEGKIPYTCQFCAFSEQGKRNLSPRICWWRKE